MTMISEFYAHYEQLTLSLYWLTSFYTACRVQVIFKKYICDCAGYGVIMQIIMLTYKKNKMYSDTIFERLESLSVHLNYLPQSSMSHVSI